MSIAIIRGIAEASRSHCDALLAAGALAALLPFVQLGMSADLGKELFPALSHLMRARPAAEMAAAATHLGAVLMDDAIPPGLLCTCLDAFHSALFSVAYARDHPNLDSWVESVLSAAPGVPRRLVDLLAVSDSAEVADVAQRLMIICFCAETDQLRLLFDCGLLDRLPPLLNGAGGQEARLHAAKVCGHATSNKCYAQLLVDSAPIIQPLLAMLSSAEGELQRRAASFFAKATWHRDRSMTRRLVDEHRALPPLVAALRRAIQKKNEKIVLDCLRTVAGILTAGDAEAEFDDRGINPYIEPLDFQLGAFELVEPLQNHSDAEMAQMARFEFVFSYFIPNDCE